MGSAKRGHGAGIAGADGDRGRDRGVCGDRDSTERRPRALRERGGQKEGLFLVPGSEKSLTRTYDTHPLGLAPTFPSYLSALGLATAQGLESPQRLALRAPVLTSGWEAACPGQQSEAGSDGLR